MKVVAKSIVVFCMLVAGCMAADAEAPDQVSSWMLVLSTPNAVVVAPTTYDTHDECLALLEVATSGSPFLGQCIPARLSPTAVEAFVAKRTQAEAEYAEKAEQLARDRPSLEAEKQQIELVPVEKRTKAQMDRLTQIQRRFDFME
nr:MAG TPA: hypothetical protein [Caudoviricetes sp.]